MQLPPPTVEVILGWHRMLAQGQGLARALMLGWRPQGVNTLLTLALEWESGALCRFQLSILPLFPLGPDCSSGKRGGQLRPTHWFPLPTLLFIFTSSPGSFLTFTPESGLTPSSSSLLPSPLCYQTELGSVCPAQQLTHQGVVKQSAASIFRAPGKENGGYCWETWTAQHLSAREHWGEATLRGGLQGAPMRDQLMEISLIGGEVRGWCFGNLPYQPSGSSQSGVHVLVVNM